MQLLDFNRMLSRSVERLQQRQSTLGLGFGAFDAETLLASADFDSQRHFNVPQVGIQRPAQMGQFGVVGGCETVFDNQNE